MEADGGQHHDEAARRYDQRRSEILLQKGIRILRFADDEILKYPQVVQEAIYLALTQQPPPTPSSPSSPRLPGDEEKFIR